MRREQKRDLNNCILPYVGTNGKGVMRMVQSQSESSWREARCSGPVCGSEPARGFAEGRRSVPGPGRNVVRGFGLEHNPGGLCYAKGQPGMRQAKKWVY